MSFRNEARDLTRDPLRKNVMRVTNTATIFAFRCERCSTELRFERLTGIDKPELFVFFINHESILRHPGAPEPVQFAGSNRIASPGDSKPLASQPESSAAGSEEHGYSRKTAG